LPVARTIPDLDDPIVMDHDRYPLSHRLRYAVDEVAGMDHDVLRRAATGAANWDRASSAPSAVPSMRVTSASPAFLC